MSSSYTTRDWQFWALWLTIRLWLGAIFYAYDWMPAFWFLLGELWPDAAWCWERDRLADQRRAAGRLIKDFAGLQTQNAALLATIEAYQKQAGRTSIASIVVNNSRRSHKA